MTTGKDKVVVLTSEFWRRRFGGEMNVLGRSIRLNDESYMVIGVLPPRFLSSDKVEFIVPTTISTTIVPGDANARSASLNFHASRLS